MTIITPAAAIATFATYDMLTPVELPRIARVAVLIDTDGRGVVSLNAPNLQFNSCQGVYIDNDTAAVITVTHRATGFRVIALPRTQGWYQMESTDDMTFDVVSSIPNVPVPMQFSNTETHTSVLSTVQTSPALDANGRQRVVVEQVSPPQSSNAISLASRNTFASPNTNSLLLAGTRLLFFVSAWNNSTSAQWLKLYNKAVAVTLGTDSPALNMLVPPGSSINYEFGPTGALFSVGIALAMTAGGGQLDGTPLPAADTSGFTLGYR